MIRVFVSPDAAADGSVLLPLDTAPCNTSFWLVPRSFTTDAPAGEPPAATDIALLLDAQAAARSCGAAQARLAVIHVPYSASSGLPWTFGSFAARTNPSPARHLSAQAASFATSQVGSCAAQPRLSDAFAAILDHRGPFLRRRYSRNFAALNAAAAAAHLITPKAELPHVYSFALLQARVQHGQPYREHGSGHGSRASHVSDSLQNASVVVAAMASIGLGWALAPLVQQRVPALRHSDVQSAFQAGHAMLSWCALRAYVRGGLCSVRCTCT